jgi:uncharacterized protein
METIALRLHPGADVRQALEALAKKEEMTAGVVLGAVGSLSKTCLRFAGNDNSTELIGKHEILTLSGMLSQEGVHLHMSIGNSQGKCIGGHVAYGCEVYTTLELVIGLLPNTVFQRVLDENTGFKELSITSIAQTRLSEQAETH